MESWKYSIIFFSFPKKITCEREKFVKINEKRFHKPLTDVFLLFLVFEIEFGVGNNLSKPLRIDNTKSLSPLYQTTSDLNQNFFQKNFFLASKFILFTIMN